MLDAAAIEVLKGYIHKGIEYVIVTELDGEFKFAIRDNQPCIGGNHRKYKRSHPHDCTRPQDSCPGDLKNHDGICEEEYDYDENGLPIWRFPDGRPSGAGYSVYIAEKSLPLFQYVTSDKSPWLKGFGSPDNIIPVPYKDDKALAGFILTTGDMDPTVWINFLFFLRHINDKNKVFTEAKKNGLSDRDALILAAYTKDPEYCWYDDEASPSNAFHPTDSYTWDTRNSIKKFITQQPDDLTGGKWSDRYDYNRPQVSSIFRDPETVPFIKLVNEAHDGGNAYITAKQVIAKELGE